MYAKTLIYAHLITTQNILNTTINGNRGHTRMVCVCVLFYPLTGGFQSMAALFLNKISLSDMLQLQEKRGW